MNIRTATARKRHPLFGDAPRSRYWIATGFDGNAQFQPFASGRFPRCRTPEGVYDMAGNAAEWADNDGENMLGGDLTGSLKTPELSGSCRTDVPAEEVGKERRGFRCCKGK